ncbi:MAG: RNA methyltransferase [Burkholderiaceae bacterium]
MTDTVHISSRDNPLLKELRKLAQDGAAYRKTGRVWIEGEHLCSAYLQRGGVPAIAVVLESKQALAHSNSAQAAPKLVVVADTLMAEISPLDSLAGIGFVCDLPDNTALDPSASTVVLDRLQDPGNVGSILRSAAAFGFKQVVALKGSTALWSPKVLRAGMGAHFGLRLIEGASVEDIASLQHPLAVTSSHHGQFLHQLLLNQELPTHVNWALGHEGQGICAELQALAKLHVRIAQPGGEESLNVAAAAAICLHASGSVQIDAAISPRVNVA